MDEDEATVDEFKETVNEHLEEVDEDEETVDEFEETVNEYLEGVDEDEATIDEDEETVDEDLDRVDENEETVDQDEETVIEDFEGMDEDEATVDEFKETVDEDFEGVDEDEATVYEFKETVNEHLEEVDKDEEAVDESEDKDTSNKNGQPSASHQWDQTALEKPSTSTQNHILPTKKRGQKRKLEADPTTFNKLPKQEAKNEKSKTQKDSTPNNEKTIMKCAICLTQYVNPKSLKSHTEKKHQKGQQAFLDIVNNLVLEQVDNFKVEVNNRLQGMDNNLIQARNNHQQFGEEMNFTIGLRNAEHAEEDGEVHVNDKKKEYVIRINGFGCISLILNKQDKNELIQKVKTILKEILPNFTLSITRVEHYQPKRNKDVFDVWFSKFTDVALIFAELQKYCKSSEKHQNVIRPTSPATRVRFSMLETIGKKVQEKNKKKNWRVEYVDMKPCLFISKKSKANKKPRSEKKFMFTQALIEFRDLIKPIDFQEAKELCTTFGIKDQQKLQFVYIF